MMENAGCILTTVRGMHPTFSGSHPKCFIVSDLYRVTTEIFVLHTDIKRIFLKSIRPLLP